MQGVSRLSANVLTTFWLATNAILEAFVCLFVYAILYVFQITQTSKVLLIVNYLLLYVIIQKSLSLCNTVYEISVMAIQNCTYYCMLLRLNW